MSEITIHTATVEEYLQADNLDALYADYAAEGSIPGLGKPNPQMDSYRQMEAAGLLHTLVAKNDQGTMVGFLSFLVSLLPHYGQVVATTESYFVDPGYRSGGLGIKLLKAAEARAQELGAVGMFVSAPAGGRLSKIMPRTGYAPSNEVFFKVLQ